jgi:hypothetical protein
MSVKSKLASAGAAPAAPASPPAMIRVRAHRRRKRGRWLAPLLSILSFGALVDFLSPRSHAPDARALAATCAGFCRPSRARAPFLAAGGAPDAGALWRVDADVVTGGGTGSSASGVVGVHASLAEITRVCVLPAASAARRAGSWAVVEITAARGDISVTVPSVQKVTASPVRLHAGERFYVPRFSSYVVSAVGGPSESSGAAMYVERRGGFALFVAVHEALRALVGGGDFLLAMSVLREYASLVRANLQLGPDSLAGWLTAAAESVGKLQFPAVSDLPGTIHGVAYRAAQQAQRRRGEWWGSWTR